MRLRRGCGDNNISTHAPRTGSDNGREHGLFIEIFQPTLPARGATDIDNKLQVAFTFQPTLPARGATADVFAPSFGICISTHAPRTGSDDTGRGGITPKEEFQPTLPARGATSLWAGTPQPSGFQPTLPARGATNARHNQIARTFISTHAPRTGSDNTTRQ